MKNTIFELESPSDEIAFLERLSEAYAMNEVGHENAGKIAKRIQALLDVRRKESASHMQTELPPSR